MEIPSIGYQELSQLTWEGSNSHQSSHSCTVHCDLGLSRSIPLYSSFCFTSLYARPGGELNYHLMGAI